MNKNLHFFFTVIKNAQISKKSTIFLRKNKKIESFLKLLWSKNFILGYKILNQKIKLFLKYLKNQPFIITFKFFSNLKEKNSFSLCKIWKIKNKESFLIFSTSLGLKTLIECRKSCIGGRLFFILK
jgi:ribosomal protein S8